MGTCIRRETGIELEENDGEMLNHKDMREKIMKMKTKWLNSVRHKEEVKRETEYQYIIPNDLNLYGKKSEEEEQKEQIDEVELHNFEEEENEVKNNEKSFEKSIPKVEIEEKVLVTEEKPMVARSGLPRIPAKRNKDKIVLRKYDSNENYKYEGEESFLKFR